MRSADTSAAGEYRFASLPLGPYTVIAEEHFFGQFRGATSRGRAANNIPKPELFNMEQRFLERISAVRRVLQKDSMDEALKNWLRNVTYLPGF